MNDELVYVYHFCFLSYIQLSVKVVCVNNVPEKETRMCGRAAIVCCNFCSALDGYRTVRKESLGGGFAMSTRGPLLASS